MSLTQDLDSIIVLNKIQEYLKCGYITRNHKTHSAELVISSLSDLKNIIIPHIEKYPVYSSKQYSFLILKEIPEKTRYAGGFGGFAPDNLL